MSLITADRVMFAGGLLLVGLLSLELMTVKKENAALHAEIAESVQNFVSGAEIPALDVQLANQVSSLNELCLQRAPMAVFFSTQDCDACQEIEPIWSALARSKRDVQFVRVHLDGLPPPEKTDLGIVHTSAQPTSVITAVGIRQVPAMLMTDSECRIEAFAAGNTASRVVLDHVGAR